jgi:Flp pilus assembly protein CpaB
MKSSLVLVAISALVTTATPDPKPAAGLEVQAKARGFTLETSLVGGAAVLRAGDHVDVLAVMPEADTKRLVGVTLLQNVIVLANAAPAPGEPRQLTLLLLPEEAQMLALAKDAGHLSATLRNPEDKGLFDTAEIATIDGTLQGKLVPRAKHK